MNPETVKIMCPKLTCRKVLSVPASARGRTVRCRLCGTAIKVPQSKPAGKPDPADPNKKG